MPIVRETNQFKTNVLVLAVCQRKLKVFLQTDIPSGRRSHATQEEHRALFDRVPKQADQVKTCTLLRARE